MAFYRFCMGKELHLASLHFIEFNSYFFIIFVWLLFSIKLLTILMSLQNSIIEILSSGLMYLLKMVSANSLALFFQFLMSVLSICWGLLTSIKNMYSLSYLFLYCEKYFIFFKKPGSMLYYFSMDDRSSWIKLWFRATKRSPSNALTYIANASIVFFSTNRILWASMNLYQHFTISGDASKSSVFRLCSTS